MGCLAGCAYGRGWVVAGPPMPCSLILAPLGPSHEDCQDSSLTPDTKTKSCEQYNFFTSALKGLGDDQYQQYQLL